MNPVADFRAAQFGRSVLAADFQKLVDDFLRVFKVRRQSVIVDANNVAEVVHAEFQAVQSQQQVDNLAGLFKSRSAHVFANDERRRFFPLAGQNNSSAHLFEDFKTAFLVLIVVRKNFGRRETFAEVVNECRESDHWFWIDRSHVVDNRQCVFVSVAFRMIKCRLNFPAQLRNFRESYFQQVRPFQTPKKN